MTRRGTTLGEAVAALLAGGTGVNLPTPAPALDCSEAEFQAAVIAEARARGWAVAHFRRVKVQRGDSTYWETPVAADGAGFPDLILCGPRLLAAELKRESKSDARLSADQERWRDRFRRAGVGWHCWRPSDWPAIVATLTPAAGAADGDTAG